MGWTFFILFRQKRVWKKFSADNKLRYSNGGRLAASPQITGVVGAYTVDVFTGEHMSPDIRRARKLTAIEVQLSSRLPITGGVASGNMVQVLRDFGVRNEFRPSHTAWQESWIAGADRPAVLEGYLTGPRLDALTGLMKIKNAWLILVFKGGTSLLRLDTPDPLDSEKKLAAIVKKMTAVAKVLELEPGEGERLQSAQPRKPQAGATVGIGDADLETGGLRLEEDPQPEG
jgi:hypothetical protein